jgi:antitoxin MazE
MRRIDAGPDFGSFCRYKVYTTVRKWGNSAAVRIPAAVLEGAHVQMDQEVDIRAEAGRIVIEPVRERAYKLSDLLRGITSDNLHKEIAW